MYDLARGEVSKLLDQGRVEDEHSLIGTLRRCLQKLCDSSTVPSPTFWTGTADPPRCQHLVAMVGFNE